MSNLTADLERSAPFTDITANWPMIIAQQVAVSRVGSCTTCGYLSERWVAIEPCPGGAIIKIVRTVSFICIGEETHVDVRVRAVAVRCLVPITVIPVVRSLLARKFRHRIRNDGWG